MVILFGRRVDFTKIVTIVLLVAIVHRLSLLLYDTAPTLQTYLEYHPDRGYGVLYASSWRTLTQSLKDARPAIGSFSGFDPPPGSVVNPQDTVPPVVDMAHLSKGELKLLKSSHARFVKDLQTEGELSVIYKPGTKGIIFTATGGELPYLLISIRLLRKAGSQLPIEVFLLRQQDFNKKICLEIFNSLNARCSILEEHLGSSPMPSIPQSRNPRSIRSQEALHKLLAIYASTFEDVLLLDPSTLAYNNPDSTLIDNPFTLSGLLFWPDFWASSISPAMEDIQQNSDEKMTKLDSIRTVDFGQLAISKSQHRDTLLLSIFYTFYGPNLFEFLQNQSSAGDRGAQAIKCAARFARKRYYQVKRQVEAIGFPNHDQKDAFQGVAMRQSFVADDFNAVPSEKQRPLFIRQSNPTLHPAYIMDRGVTVFKAPEDQKNAIEEHDSINDSDPIRIPAISPIKEDAGAHHRLWEWFDGKNMLNGWANFDPEKVVWEEIAKVACIDFKHFPDWPINDNKGNAQNCARINYHRGRLGWSNVV
ncbi:uncharacterized protein FA14DRAFT_95163 [Meira miltonrushii]|uniref:Nucleotide-diphospho-sugar transferase n=1 Tax=Meira miltonrushii TaxID=1280837 RepID=A0A316V1G0_9BASI|nr:uncharacterized protein FA14DRAFT_95163 [Meira miltonrushii]PWN31390.1 hypothetical protein FA14DRAFT_95163 [Meira miltonrushii]